MKKTIAIIFGGQSSEYSISLESTYSVLNHIDHERFDVYMIGISRNGEWKHFVGDINKIENDSWYHEKLNHVYICPDATKRCLIEIIDSQINEIKVDAILPILHGKNGEDGSIQGLIQLSSIPLIGCDVISSALCMDKYRAHQLVKMQGIEIPQSVYLENKESYFNKKEEILSLRLPLYIKPVQSGSSLGISRITSFDLLDQAVEHSFEYDHNVIIEEEVNGFEVGCAVMGVDELIVGEVDEIEISEGFFNFEEKYTLKTSKIHMPARIDDEMKSKIQATAKKIYKTLGCQVFARVDMFLTKDKEIIFNEVNTIPGFTAHSRYPNMMKGINIDFQHLLTKLIEMGIENADHRA